jgi:coenzyme PQQ precursor peptide PqqA
MPVKGHPMTTGNYLAYLAGGDQRIYRGATAARPRCSTRTEELRMSVTKSVRRTAPKPTQSTKRAWVKPDFRDFDTPMEVTAYAARS